MQEHFPFFLSDRGELSPVFLVLLPKGQIMNSDNSQTGSWQQSWKTVACATP